MSSSLCALCPGGAAPVDPSLTLAFSNGDSYTCGQIADFLPTLNIERFCIPIQEFASGKCCESSYAAQCNQMADTCPVPAAGDGKCRSEGLYLEPIASLCSSIMADCVDCDPCREFHYTSCSECTSNPGCLWCPSDALCYSQPYLTFPKETAPYTSFSTCAESDWVKTCETSSSNVFSDPLYSSDAWVYEMINIESVWKQGITGKGVHIRINDEGVDFSHPEFAGKVDVDASCELYLPFNSTDEHGTVCASIAAALGDNDECAVGIAPDATISSCRIIGVGMDVTEVLDVSYFTHALESQDISSNSYGAAGCTNFEVIPLLNNTPGGLQECPFRPDSAARTADDYTLPINELTPPSPCSKCDFTADPLDENCTIAILLYCSDMYNYDSDPACDLYLELFTTCQFGAIDPPMQAELAKAIKEGRGGKGLVIVYAAGNTDFTGDNVNYMGYQNSRFTITVGAVGKSGKHTVYSNTGASVFVSAPGGDPEFKSNFVTAWVGGGCKDATVGTSYACPVVAGVIALMLEVNPDLGWRDVQGILASTSQVVDSEDDSWVTNAAGYNHSYLYGFGVVDAAAAVDAASSWVNFDAQTMLSATSGTVNIPYDDNGTTITSDVTINGIMTVEAVVVYLEIESSTRGELDIRLVSPEGTESVLTPGLRPENAQLPANQRWKLMTVRSWGESSAGKWTLSIADNKPGDLSECVDLDMRCKNLEILLSEYGYTCDLIIEYEPIIGKLAPSCCYCGGGKSAASIKNQLISWTLVVYGHDMTGLLEPTVSPAPSFYPETSSPTWFNPEPAAPNAAPNAAP